MSEGLAKMLADISQLKITPDADLEFLIGMETGILQKLKAQAEGALAPSGPGAGMGGMGMMGMPGASSPPPSFGPMGAGGGGPMQGPQMPNPDELRRMMQQ
jgi:hypothetical protein